MEANLVRPNSTTEHSMCTNQKIFSTLYYSFNVLGLCIILGLGGYIIALDLCLEPFLFGLTQRLRRRSEYPYSRLEWSTNTTLQLQRLAHEELGFGTWSRCDKDVPVTEVDEALGLLDTEDRTHVRLIRPPKPTSHADISIDDGTGPKEADGKAPEVSVDRVDSQEPHD